MIIVINIICTVVISLMTFVPVLSIIIEDEHTIPFDTTVHQYTGKWYYIAVTHKYNVKLYTCEEQIVDSLGNNNFKVVWTGKIENGPLEYLKMTAQINKNELKLWEYTMNQPPIRQEIWSYNYGTVLIFCKKPLFDMCTILARYHDATPELLEKCKNIAALNNMTLSYVQPKEC